MFCLKCTWLWLGGHKFTDPLPDWISPVVFQEYLRTFGQPDTIRAICEDERAAVILHHDALVHVWPAEGEKPHPAHIFDLMDPAKFTLLMFDRDPSDDRLRNAAAAALIAQALPMAFNAWHVSDSEEPDFEAVYGSERPSFCLIRPDGYVMLRGTPSNAVAAAEFCRRALDHPRL